MIQTQLAHGTPWWAIIGVEPTPAPTGIIVTPHDKARRLAEPTKLGRVVIRPGGREFVEYVRSTPNSLGGWTCYQSWPLIVEAVATSSVPLEFESKAFAEARRVAALVALAWQEPWNVRTGPTPAARMQPRIPESDSAPVVSFGEPPRPDPIDGALPGWIQAAWTRLDTDESLGAAMLTWHEGLVVEAAHPSLGLIAYTGAVEAIAASQWGRSALPVEEPVRCETCGHVAYRTSNRFRKMVQLVADAEQHRILKPWYQRRSSTAHAARLHGVEDTYGAIFDLGAGMTTPNFDSIVGDLPEQRFVLQLVPGARRVVRDLLVLALTKASSDIDTPRGRQPPAQSL